MIASPLGRIDPPSDNFHARKVHAWIPIPSPELPNEPQPEEGDGSCIAKDEGVEAEPFDQRTFWTCALVVDMVGNRGMTWRGGEWWRRRRGRGVDEDVDEDGLEGGAGGAGGGPASPPALHHRGTKGRPDPPRLVG